DAAGVMAFEAKALAANGTDFAPVPPRYKTPYFSHIMGGYAAGYYAYIWSEVLDANTVAWIKDNGGLTRENGDHFRAALLSQGGSQDALQLFRDFTGHEPRIEPLLERRGLNAPAADDSAVPDAAKAPAPAARKPGHRSAWRGTKTPGAIREVFSWRARRQTWRRPEPASVRREADGRHQGVFGLPGIQAGVLHHDRHVRLDHARVRHVRRDRLGVAE